MIKGGGFEVGSAKSAGAIIRYDGPALANHEMDVHDLAPALLALGDLCKTANEIFNGDLASVKIMVRADVEQKCFQLSISLVQSLFEHLTAILDGKSVQSAKNILEWIGIAGGVTVTAGVSLFALYKQIFANGQSDPIAPISISYSADTIIYTTGDGNQMNVPPQVHKLFQDPRILHSTKRVLEPLQKPGCDRVEFESAGVVAQYFSKPQAAEIIAKASEEIISTIDGAHLVSTIKTSIRVRKAIYEGPAKWGFMYKRAIEARIADVDWLSAFQAGRVQAPPQSSLLVDLEERVPVSEDGTAIGDATYTVIKVHGVVPPHQQLDLDLKR